MALSGYPGAIDTYDPAVDDVTQVTAFVLNQPREMARRVQQKVGADTDTPSALTLEGRVQNRESGGIRRGATIPSATAITLTDDAELFPIDGTTSIATITAPTWTRMIYLEFASALTLIHGTGNLALPGAVDLDVDAGTVAAFEWTGTVWRLVGGVGAGSGNATALQEVPISATDPVDEQVLAYLVGEWVPSDLIDLLPVDPIDDSQPALHTIGPGAHQAASGTDSRFTNARVPLPHATTHVTVGQDEIPIATTGTRGLVPPPGGTPSGIRFLNDMLMWVDPALAGGGMSNPLVAKNDILIGADPVVGGIATPGRLPPPTAGQVLRANPSTLNLEWVDPSAITSVPDHDHNASGNGNGLQNAVVETAMLFQPGAPTTPAADYGALYAQLNGSGKSRPWWKDEDGTTIDLSAGGGGGAGTVAVEDEGVAEGAADTLDFIGAGVSVSFAAGKATVTVSGGGGGTGYDWAIRGGTRTAPPAASAWDALVNLTLTGPPITIDDFADGVILMPVGQSGNQLCGAFENISSTWTRKACIFFCGVTNNYSQVGFVIRDTSGGKLYTCGIAVSDTNLNAQVDRWTHTGAPVTTDYAKFWGDSIIWIKAEYDGTNIKYSISRDGSDEAWTQVVSIARTTVLDNAPDQVGVYVNPNNVTYGQQCKVFSFG